jgi:methyl-accepting chemotaxis protein
MMERIKWHNLSIGWKYGIATLLTILIFITSVGIIYSQVDRVSTDMDEIKATITKEAMLAEVGALFRSKNVQISSYVLNPADKKSPVIRYTELTEQFDKLKDKVKTEMDTDSLRKSYNVIMENDALMNQIFLEEVIPAVESGDTTFANRAAYKTTKITEDTATLLQQASKFFRQERESVMDSTIDKLSKSIVYIVVSLIVSIIIAAISTFLVNRFISRTLARVIATANSISEGKLDIPSIDYNGTDEIGRLSDSINLMKDKLSGIVREVSSVSDIVNKNSNELSKSANEVKLGSQQVTITMEELATGSDIQARSATELAETMSMFISRVEQTNQDGEEIYKKSKNVLDLTDKGNDLMSQSIQQMNQIHNVVKQAFLTVEGLEIQSEQITKLVKVIKDIADQTNLLSLNASIEAARAGEHGKGFAVVANEVGKLAKKVKDSVTDITVIVSNIQAESSKVSEALKEGYSQVDQGRNQTQVTGETFTDIRNSMNGMVDYIHKISNSLHDIMAHTAQMGQSTDNIASISQESAAGIEETSISIQNTHGSMEEVSVSSQELAKLSKKLNELLKQFSI